MKEHHFSLVLENRSETSPVAFKVKTTSPDRYAVRPPHGVIPAGQQFSTNIHFVGISREALERGDASLTDKFLVQSRTLDGVGAPPEDGELKLLWRRVESFHRPKSKTWGYYTQKIAVTLELEEEEEEAELVEDALGVSGGGEPAGQVGAAVLPPEGVVKPAVAAPGVPAPAEAVVAEPVADAAAVAVADPGAAPGAAKKDERHSRTASSASQRSSSSGTKSAPAQLGVPQQEYDDLKEKYEKLMEYSVELTSQCEQQTRDLSEAHQRLATVVEENRELKQQVGDSKRVIRELQDNELRRRHSSLEDDNRGGAGNDSDDDAVGDITQAKNHPNASSGSGLTLQMWQLVMLIVICLIIGNYFP